jgi:hypothetical protein
MADSENKNNVHKQRIAMREAILTCLVPEDVADLVRNLINMSTDPAVKPTDRIAAIRTIFEYAVPKPERAVDVTSGGEKLSSGIIIQWEEDEDIQTT